MTKEELDEIINNSEFSECINQAAPHRVKIIQDIGPKMKEIQNDFVAEMTKAGFCNIEEISQKLKLDKKDAEAKAAMSEWRKRVMNIFRAALKAIHPNENQHPTIGQIYLAGKLLNYIGREDLVQQVMEDKNVTISFKKLEDCYPYFKDKNNHDVMVDIFQQADETQGEMCANADAIKKDIYETLPADVRYDSKSNKHGLKQANFCMLVRHKAMGIIKDQDKYTKYINNQLENNTNNIERENIMMGKTKQM